MKHERGEQLVEDSKSLIEQKARLKSELIEAKRFLEAIVEHIPEAITIVDGRDLTVRMVSKFGRELLGHAKEKVEGITYQEYSKFQDIVNAEGVPPLCEELPLIRAILKGEVVTNEEWVLMRSTERS